MAGKGAAHRPVIRKFAVPAPAPIVVQTRSGLRVCVPGSLACATTYILLEQEAWFEKEAAFLSRVLLPGMSAVDIGANFGVYSLEMAAAVGEHGYVFAYEPAAATADFLTRSRDENGFRQLSIDRMAMSNRTGQARLSNDARGAEYNALTSESGGEVVEVTTLDVQRLRHGWTGIDVLKIDTEGEEGRVIAGGRETLTRLSPLVMFEIVGGPEQKLEAAGALQSLGYELYRLLGEGSMLVPVDDGGVASWELNLFAAKPDRAEHLRARGLLALDGAASLDPDADSDWIFAWPHQAAFGVAERPIAEPLRGGLAAYGVWRDSTRGPDARYAALGHALQRVRDAVNAEPSPGRIATLARIAWEADEWPVTRECLAQLMTLRALPSDEPFLPVSPRFDHLDAQGRPAEWFFVAVMEQVERLESFSSAYRASDMDMLRRLSQSRLASPEMARRLALQIACQGKAPPLGLSAVLEGEEHLNRALFKPAWLAELSTTPAA